MTFKELYQFRYDKREFDSIVLGFNDGSTRFYPCEKTDYNLDIDYGVYYLTYESTVNFDEIKDLVPAYIAFGSLDEIYHKKEIDVSKSTFGGVCSIQHTLYLGGGIRRSCPGENELVKFLFGLGELLVMKAVINSVDADCPIWFGEIGRDSIVLSGKSSKSNDPYLLVNNKFTLSIENPNEKTEHTIKFSADGTNRWFAYDDFDLISIIDDSGNEIHPIYYSEIEKINCGAEIQCRYTETILASENLLEYNDLTFCLLNNRINCFKSDRGIFKKVVLFGLEHFNIESFNFDLYGNLVVVDTGKVYVYKYENNVFTLYENSNHPFTSGLEFHITPSLRCLMVVERNSEGLYSFTEYAIAIIGNKVVFQDAVVILSGISNPKLINNYRCGFKCIMDNDTNIRYIVNSLSVKEQISSELDFYFSLATNISITGSTLLISDKYSLRVFDPYTCKILYNYTAYDGNLFIDGQSWYIYNNFTNTFYYSGDFGVIRQTTTATLGQNITKFKKTSKDVFIEYDDGITQHISFVNRLKGVTFRDTTISGYYVARIKYGGFYRLEVTPIG